MKPLVVVVAHVGCNKFFDGLKISYKKGYALVTTYVLFSQFCDLTTQVMALHWKRGMKVKWNI
jgi:hypothetical protein